MSKCTSACSKVDKSQYACLAYNSSRSPEIRYRIYHTSSAFLKGFTITLRRRPTQTVMLLLSYLCSRYEDLLHRLNKGVYLDGIQPASHSSILLISFTNIIKTNIYDLTHELTGIAGHPEFAVVDIWNKDWRTLCHSLASKKTLSFWARVRFWKALK